MRPPHLASMPFDHERIAAAAVSCSDGRFGEHVDEFLHLALALPRYDRIALPGGPALLAGHVAVWRDEEVLAQQLRFLIDAHGLQRVILIADQVCGFYQRRLGLVPGDLELQQHEDLLKAMRRLQTFGGSLHVEAYFARKVVEPGQRDQRGPATQPRAHPLRGGSRPGGSAGNVMLSRGKRRGRIRKLVRDCASSSRETDG